MMKPEILAPAGSFESLIAAVRCSADAVYLGGADFNARRNAANFSEEELDKAIRYCHARGVKVYITLNTLVADSEFKRVYNALECACRVNADALILQDIGVTGAVRKYAPDMPMHASTQMSVQSADGIKRLADMGFSRAVLPRELSEKEIRSICESTDMELEVFVHGAQCMSVSGQCLMSSVIGSRSGNRGLCAQPCRLPFGTGSNNEYFLSLKDLSLVDKLSDLREMGVSSFKIEGRMKRPEYVAAAVTACRESLNGSLTPELKKDLQSVFSRSGFTKGYFENEITKEMFGTRRYEDVTEASQVLSSFAGLYQKEKAVIPVDFDVTCRAGTPLTVTATANGVTVDYISDILPQPAMNKATDEESVKTQFAKCGSTCFYADTIRCKPEKDIYLPVSAMNAARRECLEGLENRLAERKEKRFISPDEDKFFSRRATEDGIYARFFSHNQIPINITDTADRIFIPIDTPADIIEKLKSDGNDITLEIPRAYFSCGKRYDELLKRAYSLGIRRAAAATLDGLECALENQMQVTAFFGSNLFNTYSLLEAERLGFSDALVSCELTAKQICHLGGDMPIFYLAYGRIPLMLTRNCPVKNINPCRECERNHSLKDRTGAGFPVLCSGSYCEILNSKVLYLADKGFEFRGTQGALLYFTNESREECGKVINDFKAKKMPAGDFTRGLYFRGVE